MKKWLLSLALSVGVLSATPVMAATPAFSASQMAQVKLTDLSFKEVMRKLYSGQMTSVFVNDDDIEAMPNVGLGRANKDGEMTVALMHPVINYKNTAGESRYLVTIEKVQVFDGSILGCHVCSATADLYSFKKLDNGLFQLVSRTPKNIELSGSYGRIMLDIEEVQKNIQPLGKNLIGSLYQGAYGNFGTMDTWWEAIHLPETNFINVYHVGDAGSNNGGQYEEDSPLYYDYEGTLEVQSGNATYHPIMLTYKGEQPTEDYEHINRVNYSKIVKFDPIKKAYK